MKALTLNTHSWVEIHQIPKIKTLAEFIISQDIDLVLLQEVNQHQETPQATPEALASYLPVTNRAVHQDNYALLLVHFLKQLGANYYWSWLESHQAWHAYDEGVAVLSKEKPLQVLPIIMNQGQYDYSKVWRRSALAFEIDVQGKSCWFASTHMNWWFIENLHLFGPDFAQLDSELKKAAGDAPIILAGDFNNSPDIQDEGYTQVTSLGWHDTFQAAKQPEGEFTVHKKIAGWENAAKAMRIDFFFSSRPLEVERHQVVFADNSPQAISDHSGVLIEFDPTQLWN